MPLVLTQKQSNYLMKACPIIGKKNRAIN